jgi:hypothetical protein
MANVQQPCTRLEMSADSAGREVVVDPQSPRDREGRLARQRAVTSFDYARFGNRIELLPGTGDAPETLGRLFASFR